MNDDGKALASAPNLTAMPPKKTYEKPTILPYSDSTNLAQIKAPANM